MTVFVVKCPKCGSTNVFPTHIGDGIMCIPCGHEFDAYGPWWRRAWRALKRASDKGRP